MKESEPDMRTSRAVKVVQRTSACHASACLMDGGLTSSFLFGKPGLLGEILSACFSSLSQLGLFCEAARFHSIAHLALALGADGLGGV